MCIVVCIKEYRIYYCRVGVRRRNYEAAVDYRNRTVLSSPALGLSANFKLPLIRNSVFQYFIFFIGSSLYVYCLSFNGILISEQVAKFLEVEYRQSVTQAESKSEILFFSVYEHLVAANCKYERSFIARLECENTVPGKSIPLMVYSHCGIKSFSCLSDNFKLTVFKYLRIECEVEKRSVEKYGRNGILALRREIHKLNKRNFKCSCCRLRVYSESGNFTCPTSGCRHIYIIIHKFTGRCYCNGLALFAVPGRTAVSRIEHFDICHCVVLYTNVKHRCRICFKPRLRIKSDCVILAGSRSFYNSIFLGIITHAELIFPKSCSFFG